MTKTYDIAFIYFFFKLMSSVFVLKASGNSQDAWLIQTKSFLLSVCPMYSTFAFCPSGFSCTQPHHLLLLSSTSEERNDCHPHLLLPRATTWTPRTARDQEHDRTEVTYSRKMVAAPDAMGDERDYDCRNRKKGRKYSGRCEENTLARGHI